MNTTRQRLAKAGIIVGVVAGLCTPHALADSASVVSAPTSGGSASGAGKPDGSVPPQGSDDWSCHPAAAHREPVVLVHGTWGNQNDWDILAPQLKLQGYCVFSLDYGRDTSSVMGARPGVYATGDISDSAHELETFVERVRTATGAAKVDIVAHSQGALVGRQYLRFDGGAPHVEKFVSIAGTNHGTTMNGLATLLDNGSATGSAEGIAARVVGLGAVQQLAGSAFVQGLNAGGDTEPGIDYTVIASRADKVSTPPEATFLTAGPDAHVDNLWVQDLCPADAFDHGTLPQSPTVGFMVQKALDPGYSGVSCPEQAPPAVTR
ncbi:esterase/lipase family protein [Nocardia sp. NBC_01327]|uniref:esterase/lipase family protein n=1 Tax=Nocardia sp. NBC_01327 TaxID=2903593 RepID=UPI002E0E3CF8|nr:lipase family protein [Nocardia sp. NBC_01327]